MARHRARFAEDNDQLRAQLAGGVNRGFGNSSSFSFGLTSLNQFAGVGALFAIRFGEADYARHRFNRLRGLIAYGGFGGDDHRVSPVEDRVRYVGGFGARRARLTRH